MRFDRFIVPLAAMLVIAGILITLGFVLHRNGSAGGREAHPRGDADVAELLKIKGQAEQLAIANKLPEAHAKYREFFNKVQGKDVKEPAFWDLIEQAKIDQDMIFRIMLAQHDPAGVLMPPGPDTAPATAPAATRSFVELHPPHQGAATAPATRAATRRAASTRALDRQAGEGAALAAAQAKLPEPRRFKIARTPIDPAGFSDAMIGQALTQSNDFLLGQFKDGEIKQGKDVSETYHQGLDALCVYALIHSGRATHDPRLAITGEFMRQAIDKLKLLPLTTDTSKAQQPIVYARSLRAAILATANRPEDRDLLKDDVQWLMNAAADGAYTYDDRYGVRVIHADPRGAPRNSRNVAPPPANPKPAAAPKSLGTPKGEKRDYPGPPRGMLPGGVDSLCADPADEPPPPLDLQLADGLHDPKTGMELGPGYIPRRYMRPYGQPPAYQPQELPDKYDGPFIWDNSNSQYGLLGVWEGAEAGIEVPDAYFAAVEKHWLSCQLRTGEWSYRAGTRAGRMAMTCAGIASLYVTRDYLEAPSIAKIGRQPSAAGQALDRAFAWLEKGDNAIDPSGPGTVYLGYNLHALSRVGLASGYKYFGSHDWYRQLARQVVMSQWENGAWGRSDQPFADTLIDTAFSSLFLSRARHPIMMNKLRLDFAGNHERGEWNNRPRDLAGLTRFASRELERPLNWQIVPIDRPAADWSDAPIAYLASQAALKLSDEDLARIREFVDGGGMLFTQADDSSESFNLYVRRIAKKLFPEYELKAISQDDPLYTLQYIIPRGSRPRLLGVSNGARLLWVHSPADLADHWQQRAEKSKREAFELGVNLFVYAAGKTDLRNRIDERAIPRPMFDPSGEIAVARLKYKGQWDPEPGAWPRFARYFQWETSIKLAPTSVDLDAKDPGLDARHFQLAHLTGVAAFTPTDAELKVMRDYVAGGGTLIVEAIGPADSPFARSLQSSILPRAFPDARFEALPADHPMLHATFKGMEDCWPPRLRAAAADKLGRDIPPIRMAAVGKGRVIYLPLDATSGLLGGEAWPIFGYASGEARAIVKNIVLWSAENGGGRE